MTHETICDLLKRKFGDAVSAAATESGHPYAQVTPDRWREVALFLRDDTRLGMNLLRSITALDLPADNKLACIYHMMHVPTENPAELKTETREFTVRLTMDRDNPLIPSVAGVWPAADWHEREAFDLMGIRFADHPGLRRILCPDDWEGYPLRKDYEFPLEYHGIPATTEFELTNPKH